jgi:hypothetical protein
MNNPKKILKIAMIEASIGLNINFIGGWCCDVSKIQFSKKASLKIQKTYTASICSDGGNSPV